MIYQYLLGRAEGKENAIPAEQICEYFKISKRELRSQIVDEIEKERALIGTVSTGYFIIKTADDYAAARSFLLGPFQELKRRINALEFNYKIQGQEELGL